MAADMIEHLFYQENLEAMRRKTPIPQ